MESTTVFAVAVIPLMPVYARDVLDVGASGFGILAASMGAGFVVGSLLTSLVGNIPRKGLALIVVAPMWDVPMAVFAFSTVFPLSAALLFIMGVGGAIWINLLVTLLQTLSADHMRGRVMGLHSIANQFAPLGIMMAGALAVAVNKEFALLMGAALGTPVGVAIYLGSPALRRA